MTSMFRKIAMVRCRRKSHTWLPLRLSSISAVIIACLLWSPSLNAQSLEEELKAMRLEIQQLRQEVSSLREELRGKLPTVPTTESAQQPPAGAEEMKAAELLPVLQAQVAEQAQTKVESSSRFPVKIFGNIVSNTFLNTGEAN